MRGLLAFILAAAVGFSAAPAEADVQAYCRSYARDQANGRLTGSALLGGSAKISQDDWAAANTQALADCMAQYDATPVLEPEPVVQAREVKKPVKQTQKPPKKIEKPAQPIKKKSVTVAASSATLVPGSDAWNDYCDRKYSSFDRQSGTYTSKTGKVRRCLVTRN
jgi:outer membrane biosynthesis protein TonB